MVAHGFDDATFDVHICFFIFLGGSLISRHFLPSLLLDLPLTLSLSLLFDFFFFTHHLHDFLLVFVVRFDGVLRSRLALVRGVHVWE